MKLRRYVEIGLVCVVIVLGLVLPIFVLHKSTQASSAPAIGNSVPPLYLPLVVKQFSRIPVSLKNIAYNPQSITVTVGTQVIWTNDETIAISHSVTSGIPLSPDGKFDSFPPYLAPGQSFQFTFTSTGTYPYYCRVHLSFMTGTIMVIP